MNDNFETEPIREILQEEVRRVIADAIKDDRILHSGSQAERLATVYPGSGLSPDEISERIIEAAVHAGVSIEMSRPPAKGTG